MSSLAIYNPANGQKIKDVPADTTDSVHQKYLTAKAGQKKWAQVPLVSRIEMMKKFRDSLVKDKEALAKILTSEMGKPLAQARNEIGGVLGRIDFIMENVARTLENETVYDDVSQRIREQIRYEPLGVVANISAWNYPYLVGANVFVPALLTGNAVLYKPSEFATLTGLAIAERLHAAGIPQDVFIPVIGGGSIGAALLEQPINGVFFTGSYATGAKIAEAAARKMIKVQLELGGKDPTYVCEDVNLSTVVPGVADGAFYNTGQSCCSVERIYVHEKVYDAFVDSFVREVQAYKMGDPTQDSTYIGAITRSAQLEVLEKQVQDAVKKGAKLLCGGKRAQAAGLAGGNFFEPTVLSNVNHTMEVMREESFGPIIGIQKVKSDEEAVELMNDSVYGLTAGIYTTDAARAEKVLSQVNAGSAYWNCCDRVSPRLPWSGRGHSGMGATLSWLGILAFVQPKGWHLKG
ncbi:aldehyde dehydrogenase family protein [Bdellovibrionota bacterium FG-1]